MQESISRGGKIQFQTFDTSLYVTAHPSLLYYIVFSDHHYQISMAAITQIKQGRNFRLIKVRYCPKCGKSIG